MSKDAGKAGNIALSLDAAARSHLESILYGIGHDPKAAAAGWRSEDPFVVASLFGWSGYPVFPCNHRKAPMTPHGCKDATTNLVSLSYWDRQKSPPGWCVKTGRYYEEGVAPGLWIFDIDDAQGYVRWAELERELGPLPKTWTCMSGREGGGEHRMFAPELVGPDMKTVPRALIAGRRDKIDQKGRGGYAVIAGSHHSSGRRYHWKEGRAPDEAELARLPAAWIEAMDKAGQTNDKSPANRNRATGKWTPKHDNSDLIGDGPGLGGFHSAIYKTAIRLIAAAGDQADVRVIAALIRAKVLSAPSIRPGTRLTSKGMRLKRTYWIKLNAPGNGLRAADLITFNIYGRVQWTL